jgi:hypothetical protein
MLRFVKTSVSVAMLFSLGCGGSEGKSLDSGVNSTIRNSDLVAPNR